MSGRTYVDNSALAEEITLVLYQLGIVRDAVVPESERRELFRLRDDADPEKQRVSQRALYTLLELQSMPDVTVIMDHQEPTARHPDTDILDRAEADGDRILTADSGLYKRAIKRGIETVFVLEWRCRLQRLVPELLKLLPPLREVAGGELLAVRIVKRGRYGGQGVGYLPDRRKIVVSGGGQYIDQEITVRVEHIRRPSPGYEIIFAVPADEVVAA